MSNGPEVMSLNPKTTKEQLNAMLEQDPVVSKATQVLMQDGALIDHTVQQILNKLMVRVRDEEDKFEVKHGFMTLGRCLNFFSQILCTSQQDFDAEWTVAHRTVVDKIIPMLWGTKEAPTTDQGNYNMARLMMIAGSLIDYITWNDILSQEIASHNAGVPQDAAPAQEATDGAGQEPTT